MKKILVVDDEKPIREMIRKFLAKKGYEVFDAEDGDEALRIVQEQSPYIVLLDIRMPKSDGLEVLKKIKAMKPDVGVIMVTAVSETEVAERCMEQGAFDYITKPICLEYLEECLLAKLLDFYK